MFHRAETVTFDAHTGPGDGDPNKEQNAEVPSYCVCVRRIYIFIGGSFKITNQWNEFRLSDVLRWISLLCRNPPPHGAILCQTERCGSR